MENISSQEYQSKLFTQLVISGQSVNQAMIIAKEATDKLAKEALPYINITVG